MLVIGILFAVTLLDQLTKFWVRHSFLLGERLPVIDGLFDLRYVQNTGAAWGMLSNQQPFLIVLSFVMLVVVVKYRRHFLLESTFHRIVMGLMLAGIVGNLIDRIRLGYVVDFLDFYWKGHHFPVFNVADVAICTGVGLFILSHYLGHRPEPEGGSDQSSVISDQSSVQSSVTSDQSSVTSHQ